MGDPFHEKHHALDRRVTVVETHLTDHIANCGHQWAENKESQREIKRRMGWLLAILVGGLGSVIMILVDMLQTGVNIK